MTENAKWYVIHTYSGYENTVKATIQKHVENRGLQDLIHEISIPAAAGHRASTGASTSTCPCGDSGAYS